MPIRLTQAVDLGWNQAHVRLPSNPFGVSATPNDLHIVFGNFDPRCLASGNAPQSQHGTLAGLSQRVRFRFLPAIPANGRFRQCAKDIRSSETDDRQELL